MNADQLKDILEKHKLWLCGDPSGARANLVGADLADANLVDANLVFADARAAEAEEVAELAKILLQRLQQRRAG